MRYLVLFTLFLMSFLLILAFTWDPSVARSSGLVINALATCAEVSFFSIWGGRSYRGWLILAWFPTILQFVLYNTPTLSFYLSNTCPLIRVLQYVESVSLSGHEVRTIASVGVSTCQILQNSLYASPGLRTNMGHVNRHFAPPRGGRLSIRRTQRRRCLQ